MKDKKMYNITYKPILAPILTVAAGATAAQSLGWEIGE